jgi:phosphate-selective porin
MTRGFSAAVAVLLTGAIGGSAAAQEFRLGDAVVIKPTARLHADLRTTTDVDGESDADLDLARRRIGVKGKVASRVEFEVEREIDSNGQWRDVFVDVRASRALQVRGGHFKVPFSREQLTGAGDLDFIDRARAVDLLAPGRSAGVAVHGRVAHRVLGYEAGAFVRDGTRTYTAWPTGSEPTIAGRVTVRPRGSARRNGRWSDIELGVAAAVSDLDDGRASLRGRLTTKDVFFAPVLVSGRRLRVGGDLDWRPGPLGIRAEFLRADDARQHQGLLGETLTPLRAQGWYVSGVWAVTTRVELAARAEQLSFGTPGAADLQIWTPRAEQLSAVTDRGLTLGVNWTVHRFVRVQVNAVREQVVDRSRLGASSHVGWSPVVRIQVAN